MVYVNFLLRAASLLITLILLHQNFFSVGGSKRHNTVGTTAMIVGVLLVIFVAIRGSQQENFTTMYIVHLITGGLFFLTIFVTGFLGYKSRTNNKFVRYHRLFAKATLWLLITTLVVGITSFATHIH